MAALMTESEYLYRPEIEAKSLVSGRSVATYPAQGCAGMSESECKAGKNHVFWPLPLKNAMDGFFQSQLLKREA